MRFEDLTPDNQSQDLLEAQDLVEVKMSPSALSKFVNSEAAQGIRAGFEAELVFPGRGPYQSDEEYESEEDWDMDESAKDIDSIIDFFKDNDYNSSSQIRQLREWLYENYQDWKETVSSDRWEEDGRSWFDEWYRDNELGRSPVRDKIESILDDEEVEGDVAEQLLSLYDNPDNDYDKSLRKQLEQYQAQAEELVEEEIEEAWNVKSRAYDLAFEQWRDENEDEFDQDTWLQNESMSEIMDQYNRTSSSYIRWPHWTESYRDDDETDSYNLDAASDMAYDLGKELEVKAQANSGYHGSRPENTWIIEPDASLEINDGGDMTCEIISPPMPLSECLTKMEQFFNWVNSEGATTNASTGFHVGVSLPSSSARATDDIDYIKLVLFLGDRYVLEQFDRLSNHYAKSAIKIITDRVQDGDVDVNLAFEHMRRGLLEIARQCVRTQRTDKYESVNLKPDYIEFRSMGGEDYNRDINRLKDIISRYAYAMWIAARPDEYRQEYNKKLYKALSQGQDQDTLKLFSEYNSGKINTQELKVRWLESVMADARKTTQAARSRVGNLDKIRRIYGKVPVRYYHVQLDKYGDENYVQVSAISPDDAYSKVVMAYPEAARSRNQRRISEVYPYSVQLIGPNDGEEQRLKDRLSEKEAQRWLNPSVAVPKLNIWAEDPEQAKNQYISQTEAPYLFKWYGDFDIKEIPPFEDLSEPRPNKNARRELRLDDIMRTK